MASAIFTGETGMAGIRLSAGGGLGLAQGTGRVKKGKCSGGAADGAIEERQPPESLMTQDESALDQAARRLDRALSLLEQELAGRRAGGEGELFDPARSGLVAELERSRERERHLETAGAEASRALGQAIAQIEAVLGGGREG